MLFIVFWYCEFFNCQFYDMILTPSINKNEIVGWNNFRGRNMLTMCEEGIQPLLDSTEVVVIMKKWESINRAYTDKMVKMSHKKQHKCVFGKQNLNKERWEEEAVSEVKLYYYQEWGILCPL